MNRNLVDGLPTAAAGDLALSGTSAVFPTKCLPAVVRQAIKRCAEVHQVPEAMAGCIALGVLSAAVGKGLVVRSGPNRVTYANLFIVLGAQSGSGKSGTFAELTSPLIQFESQQTLDWQTDQIKQQAERHILEAKVRHLERGFFRPRSLQERSRIQNRIEDALDTLEANKRNNQPPRIWIEDVTPEALADALDRNRGLMASLSPEAGVLINGLVRKSGTPDRRTETLLCKGYSVEPCRLDRRSHPPILLNQPCLTLLWLLQPEKVQTLYGIQALAEGGLLARLMPGMIEVQTQPITEESADIVGTCLKNWHALVNTLLEHFHEAMQESVVTPTSAASRRLIDHFNELMRTEGAAPALFPFRRRWTEWVWRLSLVLHAAKWEEDAAAVALEDSTAEAAIALADWFIAQQLQILGYGAARAKECLYRRVLNLLNDQPQGITATVLYRRRIVGNAAEARALLAPMEAEGKLSSQNTSPVSGGHTTRRYTAQP